MAKSIRGRRFSDSDDLPKAKLNKQALKEVRFLMQFVGPYRNYFAVGMLFLFLSSVTTLIFPFVIGRLVDTSLPVQVSGKAKEVVESFQSQYLNLDNIDNIALFLLITIIIQAGFSFFRVVLFTVVGERALAALRQDIYSRMIVLPMNFFTQRRVGELTSRISADIAQISDTFTFILAEFIRSIINFSVGLAIILYTSFELSLFMLAILPVLVLSALFFGKYIRRISKTAQDRLADSNVVVEETLQGIQNVKAFANEWFERQRYGNSIQDLVRVAINGAKFRGGFIAFVIAATFGSIILVLWYGASMVKAGNLTVGELTAFLIYTTFVGSAFATFGEYYSQLQKTIGATERVREIYEQPGEPLPLDHPVAIQHRLSGQVAFERVSFAYPSRPELGVIQDLTFNVSPGQTVALVGPSGAGKSTILSLLLQFYAPDKGAIHLDGRPATSVPLAELRQQMAIVPQDVFLFGGTIRENIAYGKLGATDAEIRQAAEKANALEFIDQFPEGLDSVVGERGIKLSGGQKQRIAIARAVLRDPAILILDEATSSLDSESERLVQAALDNLMKGRTTFVIAHRLATIRKADQILVIQKGRVVESGKHEELMQVQDGLYRMLATLQFNDFTPQHSIDATS
jgi:ABC-type multidrug transport system fused ATPase/permease subunit